MSKMLVIFMVWIVIFSGCGVDSESKDSVIVESQNSNATKNNPESKNAESKKSNIGTENGSNGDFLGKPNPAQQQSQTLFDENVFNGDESCEVTCKVE